MVTGLAPTWSDPMTFARWLRHVSWVTGDRWEYPPPDFIGLPLPTTTRWFNGGISREISTMANSVLSLALLPPAPQTRVSFKPFRGTIISNLWVPGGDQRVYGYWELNAAVQQVPGFAFQWTLIDSPYSTSVAVRFDIRIYTDDNNVLWVFYHDAINQTAFSISTDNGFDARLFHFYGFENTADTLSFYIDRKLVCTAANPGPPFTTNPLFTYLSTVSADYFGGPMPNTVALPAHAQIDSYNIYDTRPF